VSKENLQTIIVSKATASTRKRAEKLARPHARRIYTSRETSASWQFRQRPPSDFVKGSFKSFPLPQEPGIVLVYGKLKRNKNPGDQRWLQFKGGTDRDVIMREWDFWMAFESGLKKVRSATGLRKAIVIAEDREIQTPLIQGLIVRSIADRARALRITRVRQSTESDGRIYRQLKEGRIGNPGRKLNKSTKRKSKKPTAKAPKYIKLRSPKTMPDPGPCAWLGSIVEWGWVMGNGDSSKKVDDKGNAIWEPRSEWMFMWSPKYKAVVAIRRPRNMYRLADVSRYGGAAKMFERFTARPAENTFEIDVPDVRLHKLGAKGAHIVYRSDKWSAQRQKSDYIHPFGKGVQIYCGPSIQKPEVFICFGGKLTLTERGLVW